MSTLQDELLKALNQRNYHSFSLDDTLEDSVKRIIEKGTNSVPIQDSYRNTLTATGSADKVESFSTYGFNNDSLNWPLWLALYNDSWVFRKAIDKPAQDIINAGITIKGEEDYSKVYADLSTYKFDLIKLLQWGRLFGGSVGVMMFEDISDEDMIKPLKKSQVVGKRMRIYVTDRWYGVAPSSETVVNMGDLDYGKPKYYDISFADGHNCRVHHSYVLRYENRTAPQLIKNGQLQGWGYAEGAHILNELSRDDQLKASITSLVNKSLIEIVKMAGMRGVFMGTDTGNEEQLRKRLEMVNWGRSYNSLTFLDKDDEYQQYQMSALSGLADLMEKNMWLVAAAVDMPGILFGDLKGGLSQESDAMERYAITITTMSDSYVRPFMDKLLRVLFIKNEIKGTPDFSFDSLVKDKINKDRMTSIQSCANMVAQLLSNGLISKYQAAVCINNYITHGVVNIAYTEEMLYKLQLEEQYDILQAIKQNGKSGNNKGDILKGQFGTEGGNPIEEGLPDKLDYLAEETPNEGTESPNNEADLGESDYAEEQGE